MNNTRQAAQAAVVCKAWSAAAVSAISTAAATVSKAEQGPLLERWIEAHAGQLRSLDLNFEPAHDEDTEFDEDPYDNVPLLVLPSSKLTQLTSLQLTFFKLYWKCQGSCSCCQPGSTQPSTSSSSGPQHAPAQATATPAGHVPVLAPLKELRLRSCEVTMDTFYQLAQYTELTRLELNLSAF